MTEFILLILSNHSKSPIAFYCTMITVHLITLIDNSLIIVMVMYFFPEQRVLQYLLLNSVSFLLFNGLRDCPTIPHTNCYTQITITFFFWGWKSVSSLLSWFMIDLLQPLITCFTSWLWTTRSVHSWPWWPGPVTSF